MSNETTNSITAQTATHVDSLDLSESQLLGLFSGGEGPRALLRGADGTVVMAHPGDQTPMGEVVEITQTYVLLRERRTIRRLVM